MPPSSRTLATRLSVLAAAAASVLALAACAGPAADESAQADAHVSSTKAASPARPTPAAAAPAVAAPLPAPEPAPAPAPKETGPLSAAVQAQIDYALTYWENYNSAEYGVLGDNDCVNFASQTLIARGWQQDGNWFHNDDVYASSSSWRSSTAFRNWLQGRPDLARALDDSQRDQV
ncbi:MAG: amidase domain-containing protein, partial [Leifsonia sp.]